MYSRVSASGRGSRTLSSSTNGNFGERTDQIVRRYSDTVTTLAAPWGQHIPVDAAIAELEKGDVRAVCAVLNETSVGLQNDLGHLAPHIRKSGALFLVDGISAVAGIPCPIEAWGIDALVAGSQKGLAAPCWPRHGPPVRAGPLRS